jgi:tripartite-type tricarboxylate transporter receptor subunit TctC
LTHVAYTTFAQMMNDVAAGRVDLFFDYPLSSLPHVRDGKVRALAINAPERLAIAPEIPTTAEAGVKGAELYGWSGIYVPADVPQPAVAKLAAATVEALNTPEVKRLFDETGTVLWAHMDAARMRQALAEEIPRMKQLIGKVASKE